MKHGIVSSAAIAAEPVVDWSAPLWASSRG